MTLLPFIVVSQSKRVYFLINALQPTIHKGIYNLLPTKVYKQTDGRTDRQIKRIESKL